MASRTGQLLIASAHLGDPNFFHTIVLLVQDDDEHGALGLVLNRPTDATVKEACADDLSIACAVEAPLFKGGPCEGLLTVLHTREDAGDVEVLKGVYFTSRREAIESIMLHGGEEDLTSEDHVARYFVGYSGWSTGQLDAEIQAGGWLMMPATREHVFTAEIDEQWNKLITEVTLGKWVDPDQMPEDPSVN